MPIGSYMDKEVYLRQGLEEWDWDIGVASSQHTNRLVFKKYKMEGKAGS
jgi:hypothetical protein